MSSLPIAPSLEDEVSPAMAAFYRRALRLLVDAGVPFLVGGAFAHACFTGIRRSTKDLDLFIRREDYDRVAALMHAAVTNESPAGAHLALREKLEKGMEKYRRYY